MQYVDSLVPTVRRALIDPLPEVRVAAAKTFDQLHNTIGTKALDDILPDLLKKMVFSLFPAYFLMQSISYKPSKLISSLLVWCALRKFLSWSSLVVF